MKILAMVLAGGNGTRLHPLTAEHAKPALPFARGYRIVDFVLSNLVNSGISTIHVLVQYKPRSLIAHIRNAWAPWCAGAQPAITVALAQANAEGGPFKGTADAVYQNLDLIERERPDLVAVFAADHIYRMDVRQMARFHQERGAEVSIAAAPVPIELASAFGIMATGSAGELREFQEKPGRPAPMPADARRAYASMGNYLFDPGVLRELLEQAARRGDTDFGCHILPRLAHSHRVFAYDFGSNIVPGVRPYEERGYWRDIGTPDAYRAAQRDVLGPLPRFDLVNPHWPIRSGAYRAPPRALPRGAMPAPAQAVRTSSPGLRAGSRGAGSLALAGKLAAGEANDECLSKKQQAAAHPSRNGGNNEQPIS
jgi:glucose-1-phosphate adenylyltransferase